MVLTFSIKKEYEILLEITVCEEVISNDIHIPHLLQQCFERVFRIIGQNGKKENEVVLEQESEDEDFSTE